MAWAAPTSSSTTPAARCGGSHCAAGARAGRAGAARAPGGPLLLLLLRSWRRGAARPRAGWRRTAWLQGADPAARAHTRACPARRPGGHLQALRRGAAGAQQPQGLRGPLAGRPRLEGHSARGRGGDARGALRCAWRLRAPARRCRRWRCPAPPHRPPPHPPPAHPHPPTHPPCTRRWRRTCWTTTTLRACRTPCSRAPSTRCSTTRSTWPRGSSRSSRPRPPRATRPPAACPPASPRAPPPPAPAPWTTATTTAPAAACPSSSARCRSLCGTSATPPRWAAAGLARATCSASPSWTSACSTRTATPATSWCGGPPAAASTCARAWRRGSMS